MPPFSRIHAMTIEGLGRKFQEARHARNLTLDEAARMTKIRPARLAEIEADDFSQFPSLAYAKGFLVIYGKFLDVDVTPYLDAFEDSKRVTVDGYSYLQDNPPARPISAPAVRRRSSRAPRPARSDRVSPMPLIVGVVVLIIGFLAMKLIVNVQRLAPGAQSSAQSSPGPATGAASTTAPAATSTPNLASAPTATPAPSTVATASATAVASGSSQGEPEVRRAKPVTKEDLSKSRETASSSPTESSETKRVSVSIRPVKRTYIKVTVDDETHNPALERWISPADGPVEFHGKHVAIRVLDRDAIQISKNGEAIEGNDEDVTVN